MANYSLILDTKFKPFSYQEMLAPVAAATQAHQALEDAYGELSAQAKTWGQYADEQTDYETYKMYKTYADDLEMQAEQLMRQGLTPSSRREMLNLRARYGEEIAPIEAAYKRREALAAEQRKLYAADKTLRFERDASTMKLSDFIKNPSLDYGESYSGALLTSQVSNAVAAYQKALTDPGKLKSLGLPFQYERYLQEGATPEQVLAAMKEDAQQGDSEAVNFLRGVVDQVLVSSGVSDWADNNTLDEFRAFANQGLYNAIGTTKIQNYTDSYSMQNALAEAAETRAAARAKREAEEEGVNKIKTGAVSYLKTSGNLAKYEKALQGLKVGNNGVKASIFGKNGKANAMKVYEEVNAAFAEEMQKPNISNRLTGDFTSKANTNAFERFNRRKSEIMKKYGVTEVLTQDQYSTLKAIGYKGGTTTHSYSQFTSSLDKLAQNKSYYSTSMSNYNIPDQIIRGELGNWDAQGTYSGSVYKLNADGTRGKAVKYKDLKLLNDSGTGRKVTNIYYDPNNPDKIIVQLGDQGDRYLMDPNVLGANIAGLIGQSNQIIKSDPNIDLTEAGISTTIALSRMLNAYNPTLTNTSSTAGN